MPGRPAVVSERGEDWTASWLDPCGWDIETNCLLARNGFAARTLSRELRKLLADAGATVTGPGEAPQ